MSDISGRILKLINGKDISYGELAKLTGIPKSALQRYAVGETVKIPLDRLERIATALNTTPAYLMGWETTRPNDDLFKINGIMPVKKKKVPMLGDIACGKPIYADEQRESYVMAGTDIHADFCLRAKGDSMINARIMDGDIVFIRSQDMVEDGEIAAVIIDNEATLKRVYYDRKSNILQLVAENPAYRPMVYSGDELNHVHILGKAIAFQSDIV